MYPCKTEMYPLMTLLSTKLPFIMTNIVEFLNAKKELA
ncbi:hypothetical protein BSM4216_3517 [Bacillus smithii]|nr:hypothetical protein BSM4216_3517 [Bacillus smithii]